MNMKFVQHLDVEFNFIGRYVLKYVNSKSNHQVCIIKHNPSEVGSRLSMNSSTREIIWGINESQYDSIERGGT